jgi:IclR family transcriptional regulator, KDG regulon repressor
MDPINKTFEILKIFLNHEEDLGLSDLVKLSGLSSSTTHRITSILVNRGFVNQARSRGKYSLGIEFIQYGDAAKRRNSIRKIALPFMEDLMKETGESINLAVRDRNMAFLLEKLHARHDLGIGADPGSYLPFYCSGVGKVLLANMKDSEIEDYFNNNELKSITPKTITFRMELKNQLATIRKEGCAIDDKEYIMGTRNVAAPIRNLYGEVVASIGVVGPSARLTRERMSQLIPIIKTYAENISKSMGYKG